MAPILPRQLLLCAAAMLVLAACLAAPALSAETVKLTVDGVPVDFTSKITQTAQPAIMVGDHVALPVRFLSEVLGEPLGLHLGAWGIVQIGDLFLREGEAVAISSVAQVGGSAGRRRALAFAPRVINGVFYVPAADVLAAFGHGVAWDAATSTLSITQEGNPMGKMPGVQSAGPGPEASAGSEAERAPLRRPVVFSYNHPWGSDHSPNDGWTDPWFMDFAKVRLSTANMVDAVDPKAYAAWRTPDRRILARVRHWATPWQDDKANDLVKTWDEALSQEGIDGFAMDEFIGSEVTPELVTVWATAIAEIRRRHPDKILAFWTDSGLGRTSEVGDAHTPLLQALRDHADFVMPEIYYQESAQPDFATSANPFPHFRAKVEEWEAAAPGITPKVLMGLGTVQNVDWGYDDREDVDYGEFLAKQVEVCATDPVLRQTAGLALYAPGYLRPETLTRVNEAIEKWYSGR